MSTIPVKERNHDDPRGRDHFLRLSGKEVSCFASGADTRRRTKSRAPTITHARPPGGKNARPLSISMQQQTSVARAGSVGLIRNYSWQTASAPESAPTDSRFIGRTTVDFCLVFRPPDSCESLAAASRNSPFRNKDVAQWPLYANCSWESVFAADWRCQSRPKMSRITLHDTIHRRISLCTKTSIRHGICPIIPTPAVATMRTAIQPKSSTSMATSTQSAEKTERTFGSHRKKSNGIETIPTAGIICATAAECLPPIRRRVLLRVRRRHVKFILVNDRSTSKQSSCALCREPIGRGYLRELGTGLFYCDHDCYADHCKSAARALANFTRASWVFLASPQMKARSETER
jgi:hypothetical protein